MANPVTYNSGSNPSGALKFGTVSMSVATSLDITGYNWRNGFENNNVWVIYSDTYSQGQSTQGNSLPTIWGTPTFTEQGFITLVNVLPARAGQTAFTTFTDAMNWLISEGKYFVSNQNYPQTVVSDLFLFLDAGFTASYPNIGTTFYDLSGNGKNFTLTNGPSWNSSYTKSNFSLDGADDAINRSSSVLTTSTGTVVLWIKTTDLTWLWVRGNNNNSFYLAATYPSVNWYSANCGSPTYFVDTVSSTNPHSEGVLDGRYHMFEARNVDFSSWTNYEILSYPGYSLNGSVSKILMYNRNITSDESSLLYYQGSIVSSNLKIAIDPANIISYTDTGTSWYDMSPTKLTGTLVNGVVYTSALGGYFNFDGADDYATFGAPSSLFNPATSTMTMMGWIYVKNPQTNILIGLQESGAGSLSLGTDSSNKVKLIIRPTSGSQGNVVSNTALQSNRWYHIAMTKDTANSTSNCSLYINGVLDITSSSGVNFPTSTGDIRVGVYLDALTYSNINVGNIQVYDTALTSAQIQQNYGAFRNRYEYFGAFAQGGTESTITQNGVNYRVHTFLSSGSLTITETGVVEVLVVAGGGSGGGSTAGGGGAGGLIYDNSYDVTAGQTITVTVGAGGAGVGPTTVGNDGSNSVFGTITATGGGGGGMTTGGGGAFGRNGGSGGGGAHYSSMDYGTPGSGIPGQGYDGGDGSAGDQNNYPSGGGGGAGGVGGNPTTSKSGNGGIGQPYGLTGTTVYYAGGGGGGSYLNGGNGGNGGGGAGTSNGTAGANAQDNTGGGGGGGWLYCCGSGGAGGSGLIIIRYPIV